MRGGGQIFYFLKWIKCPLLFSRRGVLESLHESEGGHRDEEANTF